MIRCMGCMGEMPDQTGVCPYCGYTRGTPPREAYHLAPESILSGRYIIGRVLGFGGFGVTYIGWDAQLERIVAIKEFLPTTFATRLPGETSISVYEGTATEQYGFGLERFVQEAQRLAQFNGIPGITDIYDTFGGNNTAYIIMEFLKGRDIKNLLATEGALPYERARDIVIRICDTLSAVHAKGIIHRDISPDNIFLTDKGEVKLLDFGAARYESSVNSKSLSVILKSGYAPEEQYRSKGDQGPWTDVYALAATFYKMLTGVTPPDSMERAVKDELKEPTKMGVSMPQSAENALLNGLNIRKNDRTKSVEEFKKALLADGVERVKVKHRKAETGSLPGIVKIAMGLAGLLLVALVAFSATGVINLGSTLNEGGAAVPDGQAAVPNLTGKTQQEAEKLLEKAGLKMMVEGVVETLDVPADQIMEQLPLAGRHLEKGANVQVVVSGGSLADKLQANTPVLAWEGERMVVNSNGTILEKDTDGNDIHVEPYYEFSDVIPEGYVTRYEMESDQMIRLWISAGADNATHPAGTLRAGHLSNAYTQWDGRWGVIEYAVAAPPQTGPNADDLWFPKGMTTFQVSSDGGATWLPVEYKGELIKGMNGINSAEEDAEVPYNLVWQDYNIGKALALCMPQLAGQALHIRVDFHETIEAENNGADILGPVVQSIVLEQTLTLNFAESALPKVTGNQVVSWEELDALIAAGELDKSHRVVSQYEGNVLPDSADDQGGYDQYTVYRLFGDFVAGETYGINQYRYNDTPAAGETSLQILGTGRIEHGDDYPCVKDGELLIIQVENSYHSTSYALFVSQENETVTGTCDEKGNFNSNMAAPSEALMVYGQIVPQWDGMSSPISIIENAA